MMLNLMTSVLIKKKKKSRETFGTEEKATRRQKEFLIKCLFILSKKKKEFLEPLKAGRDKEWILP